MLKDLTENELKLATFMSDLSERCYSAAWMLNLEYVLWDSVLNGPRKYGQDNIDENDIRQLSRLSTLANTWIIFDDETEETAVTLEQWKKQSQIAVKSNEKLTKG